MPTIKTFESVHGPFNVASADHVRHLVCGILGFAGGRRSRKTGNASVNKDWLEQHQGQHPILKILRELKPALKYEGNFIANIESQVIEDVVHPDWRIGGARTWRISCSAPNLQNLPKGPIRGIFAARPGKILIENDYSQIELRVLASLAREEGLLEVFAQGGDPHRATAQRIFKKQAVSDKERSIGKRLNFGTVYGISATGLRDKFGIPLDEGEESLKLYWASHPAIHAWKDRQEDLLEEYGCVYSPFGKVRHLPETTTEDYERRARQAGNFPVQSGAGEITLNAMLAFERSGLPGVTVLQVHDSIVVEVDENIGLDRRYREDLRKVLTDLRYPWLLTQLAVDTKYGHAWGDMEDEKAEPGAAA